MVHKSKWQFNLQQVKWGNSATWWLRNFVIWREIFKCQRSPVQFIQHISVARAFPGGQLAHPEGQNEEENEQSLKKNKKKCSRSEEKMKVELLPTRDCEAGYGPDSTIFFSNVMEIWASHMKAYFPYNPFQILLLKSVNFGWQTCLVMINI